MATVGLERPLDERDVYDDLLRDTENGALDPVGIQNFCGLHH